jgi:PAS domain S-box-containing protein
MCLTCIRTRRTFFTGEEIRLISEITDDISFALESLRRKELQRAAEDALRESEARFKLLIESAPEGIFVQTHLHFAYVNSTAVRFFGALSENDLIGSPVLDRFDPRFRDVFLDRIHQLNERHVSVPMMEQVYLKMDGTPFPVEVAAVPIRWKGEDGALVFFRDITERKLAEEEHRRNQEWLQLYFDLPFIGMAVTSPRTRQWLRVNDRLCEILGYPREELTRKSWAELTHPDDLDADMAEFEKVMRGESEGYKMDKRFIRGDGTTIYATIDVKCVRTDRGEVDFPWPRSRTSPNG